jgi:hypothetical protein
MTNVPIERVSEQKLYEQKKAEFLLQKQELTLVQADIQAIDAATPKADIIKHLFKYFDTYKKISLYTTDRIVTETNFNPKNKKNIIDKRINYLVVQGIIPQEVINFARQIEALNNFSDRTRLEGLKAALIDEVGVDLTTNHGTLAADWQIALGTKVVEAQTLITSIQDRMVPAAKVERIEDPKEKLVTQAGKIDWTLLFAPNPTLGTPIKELVTGKNADTKAKFRAAVDAAASAVDAGRTLDQNAIKELKRIHSILVKNLTVFAVVPTVLEHVMVGRLVISEALDRNKSNQTKEDLLDAKDDPDKYDRVVARGFYQRPTHDLAPGIAYSAVAGRDEANVFLDRLGRERVDKIEELGLRLFASAQPEKALRSDDVATLRKTASDIQKIQSEYTALLTSFGSTITSPAHTEFWEAYSAVDQKAQEYLEWINFILKDAGHEINAGTAADAALRLRAPELQAAQELWNDLFLNVCRGADPLANMENWGNTIMTAFYRSTEPAESFKAAHELKRFSAWKDALRKVAAEKQARGEADYSDFYYLSIKVDNIRKVTDEMITHSQGRGMTSNWHREDARAQLKGESVALHEFTPTTIDFFRTPLFPGEQVPLDTETQQRARYRFAEQFMRVKDRIKKLLGTPGSPYFGRGFKENNTSKVAMKEQLKKEVRAFYPIATNPELRDEDIAEVVDIAYTTMTFAGYRMDQEAELIGGAGYSPAGLVADRMATYDTVPAVETLYASYEFPRYLPEMQMYYPPFNFLQKMVMRMSTNIGDDYYKRSVSMRQSIMGTDMALYHYIPPRTKYDPSHIHWKEYLYDNLDPKTGRKKEYNFKYAVDGHGHRPFGYALETWPDGMLRWPYPSMYRFLFEPELLKIRKDGEYTFETWVAGYEAFLAFRKAVYPENMSVEGKSPDEAVKHLLGLLDGLIGTISKMKANMMVDWNYVLSLTIGLCDRMFIALQKAHLSNGPAMTELQNNLIRIFGGPLDFGRQVKSKIYDLLSSGYEDHVINQLNSLYGNTAAVTAMRNEVLSFGNNKFNSAGMIDMWRMMPEDIRPATPPPDEERYAPFAAAGLHALTDYTSAGNDRREGHFHLSHAAFVHNFGPLQDLIELLEHPDYEKFTNDHPGFEATVKVLGESVDNQKKTQTEAKADKH